MAEPSGTGAPRGPVEGASRIGRHGVRSLTVRLILIVLVFLMVPWMVYQQFREADREKQRLLMQSAQLQGELLARSLTPTLEAAETGIPPTLNADLARLVEGNVRVRMLLRPNRDEGPDGFYYVAAAPEVSRAFLDQERRQLIQAGILGRLAQTCTGNSPLALRVSGAAGSQELLTSITPINTDFGCWAVVTSYQSEAYLGSSIGQPYYNTPEVRAAGLIYLIMAILVTAIFVGIWRNLRRFGTLARQMGYDEQRTDSFAERTTMPELRSVAQDFDRLIEALRSSAQMMRRAAEDNAHAFKTPIGVIRQSIEPLKRSAGSDRRGERAIYMIEQSLGRLDSLVSCAQHLDKSAADLIEPPAQPIDLSRTTERLVAAFAETAPEGGPVLTRRIEPRVTVRAGEDLLETVLENLIDNALRFSPAGGEIAVRLVRQKGTAVLTVEDAGPGVDPANLERIFERYFSEGSARAAGGAPVPVPAPATPPTDAV
ncbi:MAG: sensor histidine kinase, partial [Deinococcus-Thermus bacterium]|nr:sensor histidine kinase [Deinococcota bacterium]